MRIYRLAGAVTAGILAIVSSSALPAMASGTADFYLAPATTTVAPGQTYSVQQRVVISGDTANVVEADLSYPRTRTAFLGASPTGSSFSMGAFINYGGGGRTTYVTGTAGAGISGDLLVGTTTFRAGCTSGSFQLAYAASTVAVSGVTNTAIPSTMTGARVTVGALSPNRLCLTPSVRGQGARGTVAVYGSGFASGSTPHFGSGITATSVNVVSPTQLTVGVAVARSAPLGSSDVTVSNSDGSSVSCAQCFTVTLAPTVSGISPASFARGTTTTARVSGSNFTFGAKVTVSGGGVTAAVTGGTASRLDLTVTTASSATTGSRNITVTNPDGGRAVCLGCLTIT